jgi:hypothetical protein
MNGKRWAALTLAASLLSTSGCAMFGDNNGSGSGFGFGNGSGGGLFSRCFGRNGNGNGACCGEVVGDGCCPTPCGPAGCPTCCGSGPTVFDGAPALVTPMPLAPSPFPAPSTLPTAPPPRIAPIPSTTMQAVPIPYTP